MDVIIAVVSFVVLMTLGFAVGRGVERRHFADLKRREEQTRYMLVTQIKSFPDLAAADAAACLVVAEVVVASDYLKSFLAKLRNIFGGEVKSFHTLLVRARREATLRVLQQARQQGYNAVCNIRIQTADVGGNTATGRSAMVAIIASGTAYHTPDRSR